MAAVKALALGVRFLLELGVLAVAGIVIWLLKRTSDAEGAFRLRVDPGTYTVVALWKDGSRTAAVTVVSGAFATARIVFRAK